MDIQAIRQKLEGGTYSFSTLEPEERQALQAFFYIVPGMGFTDEQRQVLAGIFIVLPTYAREQIAFFNEQFGTSVEARHLVKDATWWDNLKAWWDNTPVDEHDWVVSADLLTDAYAAGQERFPLALTLATCKMRLVTEDEFAQPDLPI
jgi:hypothetical protein